MDGSEFLHGLRHEVHAIASCLHPLSLIVPTIELILAGLQGNDEELWESVRADEASVSVTNEKRLNLRTGLPVTS